MDIVGIGEDPVHPDDINDEYHFEVFLYLFKEFKTLSGVFSESLNVIWVFVLAKKYIECLLLPFHKH